MEQVSRLGFLVSWLLKGISSSLLHGPFPPCFQVSPAALPQICASHLPSSHPPPRGDSLLPSQRPGSIWQAEKPLVLPYLLRTGVSLTPFSTPGTLKEQGKEAVPGLWACQKVRERRKRQKGPKRKWPSSLGPRNLLQDFVLGLQAHPLPHGCCVPSQQSLSGLIFNPGCFSRESPQAIRVCSPRTYCWPPAKPHGDNQLIIQGVQHISRHHRDSKEAHVGPLLPNTPCPNWDTHTGDAGKPISELKSIGATRFSAGSLEAEADGLGWVSAMRQIRTVQVVHPA